MNKQGIVTDAKLEESYVVMAGIIHSAGDKYLPIFKRLHEERELRKAAADLKNIALQVATNEVL